MRVALSDGTRVHCLQPFEARALERDVRGYFAHGIEVFAGETVLDVGANIGLFGVEVLRRTHGDVALYCVEPVPAIRARERFAVTVAPADAPDEPHRCCLVFATRS
jgi:hypothetical protein